MGWWEETILAPSDLSGPFSLNLTDRGLRPDESAAPIAVLQRVNQKTAQLFLL